VLSIGPLARKSFRAGPEIYAPKHGRLPGGFFNHRNRPEACPGEPGSSQQGLKNPDPRSCKAGLRPENKKAADYLGVASHHRQEAQHSVTK
jgi:hypothetical protein